MITTTACCQITPEIAKLEWWHFLQPAAPQTTCSAQKQSNTPASAALLPEGQADQDSELVLTDLFDYVFSVLTWTRHQVAVSLSERYVRPYPKVVTGALSNQNSKVKVAPGTLLALAETLGGFGSLLWLAQSQVEAAALASATTPVHTVAPASATTSAHATSRTNTALPAPSGLPAHSAAGTATLRQPLLVPLGASVVGQHLAPVYEGESLQVVSELSHGGQTRHIWDIKISNQGGEAVAFVTVTNSIVPLRS